MMADPARISLAHEVSVIAEWDNHMKSITIGEVRRHGPARFETICFKIFADEEESLEGSVLVTLVSTMFRVPCAWFLASS